MSADWERDRKNRYRLEDMDTHSTNQPRAQIPRHDARKVGCRKYRGSNIDPHGDRRFCFYTIACRHKYICRKDDLRWGTTVIPIRIFVSCARQDVMPRYLPL